MTIINDNTVVVFTYTELKTVLEGNNNYNYVYLGEDIVLTGGIKLANKASIVIDGTYDNVRHKLEDKKSLSASDTINVSYPGIITVKVCNLDFTGYNYYGVIYVPDNSSYKNTIIEYNNIVYTGPQISFHAWGLTRFIDANITIEDNSLTVGNEVAECNKIEIGGTTVINHLSKSNSAFWFRNSDSYFKILVNGKLEFTSPNRELFYGVNNLELTVMNNGYMSVVSHSGMAYGNFGTGNTTINANATLVLKQTSSNGSYAVWYSYGSITLNNNATLTIYNDYTGIGTANYNIYFSNSSSFILNNPKSVVLYNEKANVIYTPGAIPFDFTFSRVNLFTNPILVNANISTSTLPTYSWYKTSENGNIKGTFNSTSVNITSHNFTQDDLQTLPPLTNFIFPNKKIFSIGNFGFRINAITDEDLKMSGETLANASILISYNNVNEVVLADDNGNFSYEYAETLPVGTTITFNIKKSNDLIYHTKIIQIVFSGELVLESATSSISFDLVPISVSPIICPKLTELDVNVVDTRINSTNWKLYASVSQDLKTSDGKILDGNIIYKDGDIISILSDTPTLVYTGANNGGNILHTNVKFAKDEGILLKLNGKIINNTTYETKIIWKIEE